MMMMADSPSDFDDEDGYFGQQQVPLTDEIKEILEEYPDGQIFKEIIQNADDAKAREVKFFIDERSHGQQNLLHRSLAKFQGPALLAYNDAVFTDEDWTNIQKLKRSDKRTDPLKVGKFGIGFNSVFHVTDLPTIVSGEWLCFMDPHKKIWRGDPGHKYRLKNNKPENQDSFTPFVFADPCSLESKQNYPGTLIRFPLRNKPSELSDKLYTTTKLKTILKALKDDASILLLFLRYIEKIEVFTIDASSFVTNLFSVATDKTSEKVRKSKKDVFFKQLKQFHSYPGASLPFVQYEVTISVHDMELTTHDNHQWIVANWVGSEDEDILEASQRVCNLPWLGLAASPIALHPSRLSCFLPMPDSEEVNPPLPVCVHGTFGLTKDRRHLKWKTSDMQNDNGALWNDLLLSKMFPSCYAKFLHVLRDKCDPNMFYSFWPNVHFVNQTNWKTMLRPLLSLLLQDQLFWSQNGDWVKLESSVYAIPQMNSDQFPQVVVSALIRCGKVVVALDDRVWQAVQIVHPWPDAYPFTTINPSLVRQALKGKPASYISLSRAEKFELLHYCLEDQNYHDLPGLVLLPVVDDTFIAFGRNFLPNKAYTCSKKILHTRLLANNEAVLVNVEREDDNLHQKLIQVAKSNYTQLNVFKVEHFAMTLKQLFPFQNGWCCNGSGGGFYNENWLKTFWSWIGNYSLHYFIGIPLVPVCRGKESNGFKIVALQNISSSRVIKYNKNINYHSDLISAAGKLGCYLTCFDDFQFLYHSELNNYVHDLTPLSVLNISSQTTYQNVTFTQGEATALRNFLFQYRVNLNARQQSVVLRLCIFPAIKNSTIHSLQSARCVVAGRSAAMLMLEPEYLNQYMFCIPQTPPILTCERGHVDRLQSLLPDSIKVLSKLQIILNVILISIDNNEISRQDLLKLFSILLEPSEYHSLIGRPEGNQFINKLKFLKFIPTSQNSVLHLPSDTYDPKDSIITGLFEGQSVFPVTPFSKIHLAALREFGMKDSAALDHADIIKVAQSICNQNDTLNSIRRANKLLEFLSSYLGSQLFDTYYNRIPLHQNLSSISWLPVMVDPPKDYPKCLGWKGATGDHFVSAQHLHASSSPEVHRNLPYLIGSQIKILQYEGSYKLSPNLLTSFNISQNVPLDAMIQQYLNLISHSKDIEKHKYTKCITLLYRNLQEAAMSNCYSQYWSLLSYSEVVEVSVNKFVQPLLVACSFDEKSVTVGKLEPYLYSLPSHLQQYKELFCHVGAIQEVTVDDVLGVLRSIASNQNIHDWELAMKILKWLCSSCSKEELKDLQDQILVPIDGNDAKDKLIFESAKQVAFLDKKLLWLKKSKAILNDIMKGYYLVHPLINEEIAKGLQLKPLNTMMASTENFYFEQAGQHESLTNRLSRILKQYKDTSVLQELLQNADDAGATEVAVYYDTRDHDNSNLFFPGMANSYGPALLFYNNAEFTEEDFENIRKIAGETKMNKPLKIGKFGIGFCSVYHMTDVPSFVSGEHFVVFDPTLQCLKEQIESENNPGIKLNYCKNYFLQASNQLSPYVGIHGFDCKKSFKGTLFRFPLRFRSSKISKSMWTEDGLLSMITSMKRNAPKLLMFLNNVKKISFQRSHGNSFKKVFAITASKTDQAQIGNNNLTSCQVRLSPQSNECKDENWIIATTNSQQLEMSPNKKQYGTASVSIRLNNTDRNGQLCVDAVNGECFCYLPLHVETGLPVHVSSNFAVTDNRRGLWKADNSSTATKESNWNKILIKSVVFQAYMALLLHLKQMHQEKIIANYDYWQLWPVQLKETVPWDVLLIEFYESILSSDNPLFYSKVGSWKCLNDCKFLSSDILSAGFEKESQLAIHKVTDVLKLPVVDLPDTIWERLETSNYFKSHVIDEEQFLILFYDDNTLSKVPIKYKNIIVKASLVAYANEQYSAILPNLMRSSKCIPCCPDGIKFKRPQDIVDPKSKIALLFNPKESMCPDDNFLSKQSHLLHQSLVELGMMQILPWKMIVDRAKNQQRSTEQIHEKAVYLNTLVSYMKENLNNNLLPSVEDKNGLQKIPFLPVMQKPTDYLLNWKGNSVLFECGPKLIKHVDSSFAINAIYACGSQILIIDTNIISPKHLTEKLIDILGIRKELKSSDVFNHFTELTEWFKNIPVDKRDKNIYRFTNDVACQIYKYWGRNIGSKHLAVETLSNIIKNEVCIWNGNEFLHPATISFKWPTDGPFLYKLPAKIPESLQPVMRHLGMEDDFSTDVLVDTLRKMKQKYNNMKLPSGSQEIINLILPKLTNEVLGNAEIFLPDEKFVLKRAMELKYNDAPWCAPTKSYFYCHKSVSRETALSLGVEPVRNVLLKDFEITEDDLSEDFGQVEKLTQRLNNILRDYPKDITFVKEILQNADDAGATQLYFILDKRNHSKGKVISEAWKDLQGPSLLIWNNTSFSKDDFDGIQRLGLGSKTDDANKIGHYGIGFSVVYHFTDCPSFVTDNKLCILDPHYHYIAHKKLRPGKMYNKFSELLKKFPGMRSPYLLNDRGSIAQEIINKGTLFRLPLRLTQEMVDTSDFAHDMDSLESLETNLKEWISQVSETLLFLHHVNNVRFFVINDSGRFNLCIQEKSKITGNKIVKEVGKSKLSLYPMTLFSAKGKTEWLVQLGEGNIEDPEFDWDDVKPPNINIWPKHGIAVPVNVHNFEAKSFCFLPLPGETYLPIHIHGHFILDSNRRGLWVSSSVKSSVRRNDEDDNVYSTASDPKAVWNELLLKAVSVSYAYFLISFRHMTPGNKEMLEKELNKFYKLFPILNICNGDPWFTFSKQLYSTLADMNAPILAKLTNHDARKDRQTFVIRWYDLLKPNSADECFFSSLSKNLSDALTSVGMNLINTPKKIREQFIKTDKKLELPEVSNKSVLKYYSQFCTSIYNNNSLPCPLASTKFKNFDTFILVLNYLMKRDRITVIENEAFTYKSIILQDFSTLGLVVTADENLCSLSDDKFIISSYYWKSFPNSQQNFIHEALLEYYPFDSNYLLFNGYNSKEQFKCTSSIIAENLPSSWNQATQVPFEDLNVEWIKSFFECLENDPVFSKYYDNVLMKFPLLPATNNMMYSASSKLLPLKTVVTDELECVNQDNVKRLLTKLEVPLFRHDILHHFKETIKVQLPSMLNAEKVLESLYLIKDKIFHIFQSLSENELILLFKILKQISYSSYSYQDYIKNLPIFTTIDKRLVALRWASDVWIWNDEKVCAAGMDKWINSLSSNTVFLSPSAPWACLKHEAEHLHINNIDKYYVYCKFIFPKFHLLNRSAQLCQLAFIRDNIYHECKFLIDGHRKSDNKAKTFESHFKSLKCIPDSTGDLCTIDSFYDHNEILFKQFCQENFFLPRELRATEWLEFFKYFGLKSTPTKKEFINFCKMLYKYVDIATIKAASSVLLDVLFYIPPLHVHENKYSEIHSFQCLQEISQIPIVLLEDVPELNSITAQKLDDYHVENYSNSTFSLTKLAGSCLEENKYLVWTIRPLIKLDYNQHSPVCLNRLKDLNVILKPSVEDVISNLKHLSTTTFASYSRFATENHTDCDSHLLPEIVIAMLQHIQTELLNNKDICNQLYHHDLLNAKIIPVRLHSIDAEQYALALPTQVLNVTSPDIDFYYPFLHPLIEQANGVVHLLSYIGVKNSFDFAHIQFILWTAKSKFQENEVDPKTKSMIIKATQELVKLLQHAQSNDDIVQYLEPLYLLSEDSVLTECSKLVVYDKSGSHKLQLPSGYAYLHSLGESNLESALLYFLPKQLGLISLKSVMRYEMGDNEVAESKIPCVSIIEEILKSSEFTRALFLFSNCCTHGTTPASVNDMLADFQRNLTVKYLNTVHVKPYLVIENDVVEVSDTLNYSFFLEKITDKQWTLSLKNTQSINSFHVLLQLGKQICFKLKLKSTGCFDITDSDELPDLATFVGLLLQCDSVSSISSVIKEYIPGAQSEMVASDDSVNPPICDAHLVDLLSSEEWIGNVNEQGKEVVLLKQMLQRVASTFMEWEKSEPKIDLNEAKIWIQQAQYDHSTLSTLMDASKTGGKPHFASICFMSQQVAEKSLKAGLYAKCGLKEGSLHTHDLSYLASELIKMGVRNINEHEVDILNNLYLGTRYPNRYTPSAVPGNKFSIHAAEEAFDAATRVFEEMQEMINETT